MAWINTVVKVIAPNEEEACTIVTDLIEGCFSECGGDPFDRWDDDATAISEEVKSEADFAALREREKQEHASYMRKAQSVPDGDRMKGYYLCQAGECLDAENYWSTERLAYDYSLEQEDPEGAVFYVETYRHL